MIYFRKKMGVAYHHLSYHQSQDQKDHQDHQVLTDQEGHMVYEETLDNLDQQENKDQGLVAYIIKSVSILI